MHQCITCGARFPSYHALCAYCFSAHSMLPVGERRRAQADAEVELTDARTLARAVWQRVAVAAYPSLELGRGALVVLVGSAGGGKSSMVTRALDTFPGTGLLLSLEEPGGPSLALRLARLGVKREDLLIASRASVDQLTAILRDRKVTALAIDSVQRCTFEPRDLRHMLLTIPSLAVLFATSQVNKQGDLRGSEELRHEADVVLELEGMEWRLSKSRYQPIGATGAVAAGKEAPSDAAE